MPPDATLFGQEQRPQRAANLFDLVRHRFMTKEWNLLHGQVFDDKNGHCLIGAVWTTSCECHTDASYAESYLVEAINGERVENHSDHWRDLDATISQYNAEHSFEDAMELLGEAKRLAEADVLPW